MGASQPLNTTISVFRRQRVTRDNRRHTSVKHLTTPFEQELVPIPGEEVDVVEYRDATFKSDAFRYGHPVTVAPRVPTTLAEVLDGVSNVKVVRLIGNPREAQIENTDGNQTDDLYGELRDLGAGGFSEA